MKKITFLILFLIPILSYSQLDIVITSNLVPLYASDGDTLSACRDSMIIFEADVTDGGIPVTNAEYFWDFDDGSIQFGTDLDSVTHIFPDDPTKQYNGGGGYRVKLKVIDQSMQEAYMILAVKVAVPPDYTDTRAVLPDEQTGICNGSPAPLFGKAFPDLWEDEPVYEIIEEPRVEFDDTDPYIDSLVFDEFSFGLNYASGDIDSISAALIHSDVGDIKISLSCETGNTVVLKDFFASNDGILGDTVNNLPHLYYWSESTGSVTMNNTTNFSDGSVYLPDESFDNFIGCPLNGTWTLNIEDNEQPDTGFVYSWSIRFLEDIIPNVWTFKDTLIQYKVINEIVYGTYWSGLNVEATSFQVSGDTIIGQTIAAPDVYGNNGYDFHVITNWGCPQDTSITLRVEEVTFTAETAPFFAVIDTITFTNETKWVEERDWDFGDGITISLSDPDSISAKHTYEEEGNYEEGEYTVFLTASDAFGCQDTASLLIKVDVEPSNLQNVPNMFSPNDDGSNDLWYFKNSEDLQGMEDFKLTIYNRWGEKVFETEFTEDVIAPNGWDGTVMNKGNRKCPTGIYFYVIKAFGKDEKDYSWTFKTENLDENRIPAETRGTIHLFRNKKGEESP